MEKDPTLEERWKKEPAPGMLPDGKLAEVSADEEDDDVPELEEGVVDNE